MASVRGVMLLALATAVWMISGTQRAEGQLKVGYYAHSCPQGEAIVKDEIEKALQNDEGVGADLLRMHFHDCFVRGCDASLLLDSTNASKAEKDAKINSELEGFDVIDTVKEKLEAACKGVVSCADLLAFAARDAIVHYGGIHYKVPSGRRDGRISITSDADSLPSPDLKLAKLTDLFNSKGLSQTDMVILSGAHTVGIAHCDAFSKRLDSRDPTLNPKYARVLRRQCPPKSNNTVPMDPKTPRKFDNHYYRLVLSNRGLFTSDVTLLSTQDTATLVSSLAWDSKSFQLKFAEAIVKMGAIGVLTGRDGEVRSDCRIVN